MTTPTVAPITNLTIDFNNAVTSGGYLNLTTYLEKDFTLSRQGSTQVYMIDSTYTPYGSNNGTDYFTFNDGSQTVSLMSSVYLYWVLVMPTLKKIKQK